MSGNTRLSNFVRIPAPSKSNKTSFANPEVKTLKVKRKRKSLKPLQRSAQDENTLVGNARNDEEQISIGKRKIVDDNTALDSPRKVQRTIFSFMSSPLKIYQDPDVESKKICDETKPVRTERKEDVDDTDGPLEFSAEKKSNEEEIDPEAHRLMVQEEIPEDYWKDVAEQRRLALHETLEENETLTVENRSLKEENSALKEEVEGLKEMAGQAEYFANIVKLLTNEEDVDGCEHAEEVTESIDGVIRTDKTPADTSLNSRSVSVGQDSNIS